MFNKKRILSAACAFALVCTQLPLLPATALEVDTTGKEKLPTKLTAPTGLMLYEAGSGSTNVYLQYSASRDYLDLYANMNDGLFCNWGWDEADTGYYTAYGKGYTFDSMNVQVDYRIDGGDWHYTTDWDTNRFGNFDDYYAGIDAEGNGDDLNHEVRVIEGYKMANVAEGETGYVENEFFDCCTALTDGEDTYYQFDEANHKVEVRARYFVEIHYEEYYGAPEGTDEVYILLSDWSENAAYGQGEGAVESYVKPTALTEAPVFTEYALAEKLGYMNAPKINLCVKPSSALLDLCGSASLYHTLKLNVEASVNGKDWYPSPYFNKVLSQSEHELEFGDIWETLVNDETGVYFWDGAPIYLRANYTFRYYDYANTDVTLTSPYSEVYTLALPKQDAVAISISHLGIGSSGMGTQSFVKTQGGNLGWFNAGFVEGCYVQTVTINDKTMYDRDDSTTWELLEWDGYYADEPDLDALSSFRIKENDNCADQPLNIVFTYAGTPTAQYDFTVSYDTATGSIYPEGDGKTDTLGLYTGTLPVYEGAQQNFTVHANRGCRIAAVYVDGTDIFGDLTVKSSSTYAAQYAEYLFEGVSEAHSISADFERIAFPVSGGCSANGTITRTEAADYDEEEEYAGIGSSVTYTFAPNVDEASGDSYAITKIRITENGGAARVLTALDDDFAALVAAGTYTFANVQGQCDLYITYSEAPVKTYPITVTAGENGTASPSFEAEEGSRAIIHFTPDTGYELATLTVDGVAIDLATLVDTSSYIIPNVTAAHTVEVTFQASIVLETYKLTITATQPDNATCTVSPVGETPITQGIDYAITYTVTEGYVLKSVLVDGVALTDKALAALDGTYTVVNPQADTTVEFVFDTKICTVQFTDADGTLLDTQTCKYGEGVTPAIDVKALTKVQKTGELLMFAMWSKDVTTNVREDMIAAVIYNCYTVSFTAPTQTVYETRSGDISTDGMDILLTTVLQSETPVTQELTITADSVLSPATLDLAFADAASCEISVYYDIDAGSFFYSSTPDAHALGYRVGSFTITYEPVYEKGDVNLDGLVNANDAILILKHFAAAMLGKDFGLTAQQLGLADVNSDGTVNTDDTVLLLKFYAANIIRPTTWDVILGA